MASYNKFNSFVQYVCNGNFNLSSDTIKVGLTNTSPTATSQAWTSITEISATNGYVAGGTTVASVTSAQASGTQTFAGNNVAWTASGGSFGPFQYVVVYDSTPTNNGLIGYWNYGSSITLNSGDSFTVQFNGGTASGTIFTMS